jgi:hypothetical protein
MGIARVYAVNNFCADFKPMENNRTANVLELLIQMAPILPCNYPNGKAGDFLQDQVNQPLSLLLGAIALYGSDDPWALPYNLFIRLDKQRFDALTLSQEDPTILCKAVRQKPILHMDPNKMGTWISKITKVVVGEYGEGTSWIWDDYRQMDVSRLIRRLKSMPGIGVTKALTFSFLLYRDWRADIVGWDKLEIPIEPSMTKALYRLGIEKFPRSDPEHVVKIYSGLRTLIKKHCTWNEPQCGACPISIICPRQGV